MAFVTIAGMEFRILNRLGGGDFSRVYEVLGPDKVIRAVKMVNTLADEVEDNKEEPRSCFYDNRLLIVQEGYCCMPL